jgi:hypothetical protein
MTRAELIWPYVEQAVEATVGAENFTKVDETTITLRAGSTQVFIHLFDEEGPIRLQVFAPVIRGVERTPDLLAELNEINEAVPFAKVFWTEHEVLISTEILADALQREGIDNALGVIAAAADHFDDELKARFGGETVFPATEPPVAPAPDEEIGSGRGVGRGAGEGVGVPPGDEAELRPPTSSPVVERTPAAKPDDEGNETAGYL